MSDYHFESKGLFLGFLSYPYYVDGQKMCEDVVMPFFEEHKNRILKYDDNVLDESLYYPAAYRMFGTQGLAVLSLIDDYSFCSRHFNKNHIRTLLENKKIDEDLYKFKSIVVTGVTETLTKDKGIKEKAEETFLKKTERYPYIGVIRLKIDHRLLLGKGENAIRAIKRRIKAIFDDIHNAEGDKCFKTAQSDYIVVDCYDNDEMTIVAFSNSIKVLIHFLGNVRNIRSTEDEVLSYSENGTICDKHVFAYTYINFGYDVLKDNSDSPYSFLASVGDESDIKLNCLIETRPGHRDTYLHYLKNEITSLKVEEKIASGGSVLKATLSLEEIHTLEKICKIEPTIRDVRKMRVSFQDPIKEGNPDSFKNHASNPKSKSLNKEEINAIKHKMKSIGVSKIVRDRLLSLFEFYDNSRRNLIQALYFEELSGISSIFHSIINDLSNNQSIDIRVIEQILDGEITNMENACYDRIHNRKYAENLLEYSGGIQQHLTAYGYAYNIINNILTGNINKKETYTIITGADRVSSERTHLNLNINHILFPELFVTTAWKESANKNVKNLGRYSYKDVYAELLPYIVDSDNSELLSHRANNRYVDTLNVWYDFVKNENNLVYIKNIILQETRMLLKNDETYIAFQSIMDEKLLSYFIKDYVVFHFAFQRNFEKMWYFSFKVLLQTTNVYQRLGKIKRIHVVYMLLRLFMVGFRFDRVNDTHKCEDFIKAQMYKPFDSILQTNWIVCYKKILDIAERLYKTLDNHGFKEFSEYQVAMCEYHAESLDRIEYRDSVFSESFGTDKVLSLNALVKANSQCIKRRKDIINSFESLLENNELVDNEEYHTSDYIICLLSSFVSMVYKIDLKDDIDKFYPIKSITRDENGEILDKWENTSAEYKELCNNTIGIPCDTTGGFFLPQSMIRQRYFALRTVFYKSLWNFRMKNDKIDVE